MIIEKKKWICQDCVESCAHIAKKMSKKEKKDHDILNRLILFYSKPLKCWSLATIISIHADEEGLVDVRYSIYFAIYKFLYIYFLGSIGKRKGL